MSQTNTYTGVISNFGKLLGELTPPIEAKEENEDS